MPFMLTYVVEILVLVEVGATSIRIQMYKPSQNERAHMEARDLLSEIKEEAECET